MQAILERVEAALGVSDETVLTVTGIGDLPSAFPVTDFAVATVGAAGRAAARLFGGDGVTVDRRLASLWFGMTIRPQGWELPPLWDPIAGDYETENGWIRLHTNAPHHRDAALKVLGPHRSRDTVARAVAKWDAEALETAVIAQGGVAAQMRSTEAWRAHPQGAAVALEPLFHKITRAEGGGWTPRGATLSGLKVLDLTRILAGPIATRFLAGLGADVLRIDPLDWDEGAVIPEVALGKRLARLDLGAKEGRTRFYNLLRQADVIVHGYRPDALARFGLSSEEMHAIRPGLVEVSHSAYGWSGPWAKRRGFDSLVQMSSGIAHRGMVHAQNTRPVPLPVQALDHGCGYLDAAAVLHGLALRQASGRGCTLRLSLAKTADLLMSSSGGPQVDLAPETEHDLAAQVEATDWGPARRIHAPLTIGGRTLDWAKPARRLGSDAALW